MAKGSRLQWWRLQWWTPLRFLALVLIASAIAFVLLTITKLDMKSAAGMNLKSTTGTTWSWFWLFALLPGTVGVANYIVTLRQRSAGDDGSESGPEEAESHHRPSFSEALAAALVLSGIFLVVAKAAAPELNLDGLVYAGYGAYVSTLWSMLVRLNVSALSPRFLINSALKTSIAMLLGFVASGTAGLFKSATPALCFLIGFCLGWALKALKKSAMVTFGVTQTTAADLSVRLLEGVDDGAVDVLEELGITSIQHLATMNAAEVCGRSQYPRDRVLDWIDQSILAIHANGRINDFRALGIRSAYALVTIADYACGKNKEEEPLHGLALHRLNEASNRLGQSQEALQITAECIRRDPSYIKLDATYPNRHDPTCPPIEEKKPDQKPLPGSMLPIKQPVDTRVVGVG
ncbi:MAG TPA: hypothetical protein VNN25_25440 [Thermoanaerobaculia bacterium]|nr:hypothetical protein [Thermoanaerobaculia bacterium]